MVDLSSLAPSDFFSWVGRCIKQWTVIERQLFRICFWALHTDKRVASVVFFRTPSTESRIHLCADLLFARFYPKGKKSGEHDPPLLGEWYELQKLLNEHMPFRNVLAHARPVLDFGKVLASGALAGAPPSDDLAHLTAVDFAWVSMQDQDDRERKPNRIDRVGIEHMKAHYADAVALDVRLRKLDRGLRERGYRGLVSKEPLE